MKRISIDLSRIKVYGVEEVGRELKRSLKRQGLLSEKYLYSVFDSDRLDEFLKNGTYRPKKNIIDAFKSKEIDPDEYECDKSLARSVDSEYENPAMAIYDGSKLIDLSKRCVIYIYKYKFKEPEKKLEAVVGVVERILFPKFNYC